MTFSARAQPARVARSRLRARRWRARQRGVSEVVATILLLALTVTLFGAIFAFVSRFPTPPAQNVNQFQATVIQNSNGITQLQILQSGGPTVPAGASVILQASRSVPNWQFARSTIPVAWGMGNSTKGWSTGQYWTTTFTPVLAIPTNVSVYILSSGSLLYAAVVPGYATNLAPVLGAAYTTPTSPAIGASFWVFAPVTGNTSGLVLNISLTGIPGLASVCSGPCAMTANSTSLWSYHVVSGETTTAGTYYAFIQGASTTTAATIAGSVAVTIPSGGGGGGGSSSLSIQPGMSPQPPTLPQTSPSAYFWATVTYTGTKTNVPVSVNFTISQKAGGRSTALTVTNTVPGQTGLTISGPSSLTVYSQTADNFNSWLLNSSVTITATATLGQSVGSATGTIAFSTQNLIQGIVYVTTSSSGATASIEHSFAPCTTTCPYIYATVWDNFTTALGGPATVTVSGISYANSTTVNHEIPTAGFATQTVTEASSLAFNLYGGTTRESALTTAGTFTLAIWLTVESTATGTPTIGYIYDTFAVTVT